METYSVPIALAAGDEVDLPDVEPSAESVHVHEAWLGID